MRAPVIRMAVISMSFAAVSGCVTRPPSIAHVHIGHALTGVHVTPDHQGYVLVAEQRAAEAMAAADAATRAADLIALKAQVTSAVAACDSDEAFGVKQSVILAANHLAFAADSADASNNVMAFAPLFKRDIAAVVGRCEYIELLGDDVAASRSFEESKVTAREILKAATENVEGSAPTADGVTRSAPADYGVLQLRELIQAMIARERPAYRTVDEWYLFNLVRLPNGRWVFDKLSRGCNIDGYK